MNGIGLWFDLYDERASFLFIHIEILVFFNFKLDRGIKRPTGRRGYTNSSKIPTLLTDTRYEKLNIFRQKLNLKFRIYWQTFS